MKFCYFIQTHKNPEQIYRLVRKIKNYSPAAQVLIGHDFTNCSLEMNLLSDLSDVHLLKGNAPAIWGDFSLLQPYLNAINWLFENNSDFDWLIYLSGQDYPTQPISKTEYFLSQTEYDGFMQYFDVRSEENLWNPDEINYRYFSYSYRFPKWVTNLFSKIDLIQKFTPIRYIPFNGCTVINIPAVKTPFNDNFRCYGGSQWHTISRKCVEYIKDFIKNNPNVIDFYKKTLIPDESVIQTILINSNKFNISNYYTRYIDFVREDGGHAKILTQADYAKIIYSNSHFARKFEQDSEILDILDNDEENLGICIRDIPIIYSSVDEIISNRNNYQHNLQNLFHRYAAANQKELENAADTVGVFQPFFLASQGLNNRTLQQLYGEIICRLMSSCYPQWSQPLTTPTLQANEKVRVGIVSGCFYAHSLWQISMQGWIENLDRNEFELFGYHTNSYQDWVTDKAAKAFVKFIQGSLSVEEWCEIIQQDQIHILIFPAFGMDSMTLKLGCLRLAPIQITSWGHPDTSGLPTIDYYLSSELMETENSQEHYTEKLVRLPNLSIYYTPPKIQLHEISKQKIGIKDDETMFWCCQPLYQYLPQHDDVFPRIAQELGSCKFVFIKYLSEQVNQVFCQRLSRVFQEFGLNYKDYCIFLSGKITYNFAGITAIADVFLDNLGWSEFYTALESIAHNIPIVTLPGDLMRGRQTMAMLQMMGIQEMIAASKEDYVKIAIRLGQDPQYRQYISQQIAQNKHKLYGDLEPIRALEDFFLNAVNKKRISSITTNSQPLQPLIQQDQIQNLVQSEQKYRKTLETEPDNLDALHGLGVIAWRLGQYDAAENWLNTSVQVQPDSVKAWFSLGNLHQAQGQWLRAVEAYRRALAIQPDKIAIYNNLGYSLQQQGDWDEAIACYQKALELQPNSAKAYVNLGNALYAQGKLSPEKQAHYAGANYMLGVTQQKEGNLMIAVAYYRQTLIMQPNLGIAHYNLGVALEKQGQVEEALTCYQRALTLKPKLTQNIELIISRYNEDLNWINEDPFNQFPITIYNKGVNDKFSVNENVLRVINLKNVGRESHTYLYHIINNYDNLANITAFLPGSVNAPGKKARAAYLVQALYDTQNTVFLTADHYDIKNEFYDFQLEEYESTDEKNKKINSETKLELSKQRPFGKWFEEKFGNIVVKHVSYNGIIGFHKRHILQHPKKYYQDLIIDLENSSNPEVGHYLERSWGAVFYPLDDIQAIILRSSHV